MDDTDWSGQITCLLLGLRFMAESGEVYSLEKPRAVPGRRPTMSKSKIEDEIFKQFKEIQVGRTYIGKCGVGERKVDS